MNKSSEKNWSEDFQEFIEIPTEAPSVDISNQILSKIQNELNPKPQIIFLKLLGIHSIVGTLSLMICNQFDMNPFNTSFSLSNYFMKFGHSFCMFLCGVLFISFSIIASGFLLRTEEVRILRKTSYLQVFALSCISLGVFAALGSDIALTIGILWFIGAQLGGLLSSRLITHSQ